MPKRKQKPVNRRRTRQCNGQNKKEKQWSTKQYIENSRLSNTNTTKVLRKGKQSLSRFTDCDYPFGIFKLFLQNTTQKTKKSSNMSPTKNQGVLRCSGRLSSSCPICETRRVTLAVTHPMISNKWGKNWVMITNDKWNISVVINLWQWYSVTVAIVKLSKWWFQLNQ